jgi:hypothetical protein
MEKRSWGYCSRHDPSSSLDQLWDDALRSNLQRYFQRYAHLNRSDVSIRMCETSSTWSALAILGIFDHLRKFTDILLNVKADDQGIMVSYWIGLAFYYTSGQIAWRFPVTFQCVFTFAMYVSHRYDYSYESDCQGGRNDLPASTRITTMASS